MPENPSKTPRPWQFRQQAGQRQMPPSRPAVSQRNVRSELRGDVHEEAPIRRVDGAEIIRDLAPEIAAAHPETVSEQAIDADKRRGLGRIRGRRVQRPDLSHYVPVMDDVIIGAKHAQMRLAGPEIAASAIRLLAKTETVLRAKSPFRVDLPAERAVQDMALLFRPLDIAIEIDLIRPRHVIEIGIAEQAIQMVILDRPPRIPHPGLGIAAIAERALIAARPHSVERGDKAPILADLALEEAREQPDR